MLICGLKELENILLFLQHADIEIVEIDSKYLRDAGM
jgi:hypothetical protein